MDNRRVDLGPWPEDRRRHHTQDFRSALALHPDAQRAVVLGPRPGDDPVGQFLLNRHGHRGGCDRCGKQIRDDRGGNVVGQVGNNFEIVNGELRIVNGE